MVSCYEPKASMKVCQFYQFADVKSRQFADFHNLLLTFIAIGCSSDSIVLHYSSIKSLKTYIMRWCKQASPFLMIM